jgi:hypothetical protein
MSVEVGGAPAAITPPGCIAIIDALRLEVQSG